MTPQNVSQNKKGKQQRSSKNNDFLNGSKAVPFIQAKKAVVPPQPQVKPIQQKENENSESETTTEQLFQDMPVSFAAANPTDNSPNSQLKSITPKLFTIL